MLVFNKKILSCRDELAVEAAHHHPEGQDGYEEGQHVGGGDGGPHAVDAPVVGQDEEEGEQEDQLAGQRQEDGELGFADGLEEVLDHYLAADYGVA